MLFSVVSVIFVKPKNLLSLYLVFRSYELFQNRNFRLGYTRYITVSVDMQGGKESHTLHLQLRCQSQSSPPIFIDIGKVYICDTFAVSVYLSFARFSRGNMYSCIAVRAREREDSRIVQIQRDSLALRSLGYVPFVCKMRVSSIGLSEGISPTLRLATTPRFSSIQR